ncbi:thaumatin-like protein [Coprinellus micaceus]|uniref:Thaumatin-like protein n=1 Tax=Coprinellus micaceus TaxID=71717 RepID=A0A4Y7TEJ9_COPMI|nr:thaumatin-like protein [Coprinellus micaceus]
MKIAAPVALALASAASASRTFTVHNKCSYTIWPAIFTNSDVGDAKPSHPTGWKAVSGSQVSFSVPDNWRAGRIWGRRGCDFSKPAPAEQCLTGGCIGGLECDAKTGGGVPPATLAEFTFDGTEDWYDVSLVDGFNIPVGITNDVGCSTSDCPVDLNSNCPDPLKGPFDASGNPVGCKSACLANLDGNQSNSSNCCSGSHSLPGTCPSSGVSYYNYFKNKCPDAYAYAYDEASGTALFKCPSKKKADYTVTFCP